MGASIPFSLRRRGRPGGSWISSAPHGGPAAAHFTYLGDRVEGEHATVKTTVTAKNGSVIAVAYRTRVGEGGSWRVYDLDTEGISLVGNYRTQFNSIIARSSKGPCRS
jgi:phospholipid transport system substrate-binding protein